MDELEFILQFDLLYNNMDSNASIELNGYEKSVILTYAQAELLRGAIDATINPIGDGVEDTPDKQITLGNLIKRATLASGLVASTEPINKDYHKLLLVPTDCMRVLGETMVSSNKTLKRKLEVIPLTWLEYSKMHNKILVRPKKGQAWRTLRTDTAGKKALELFIHDMHKIDEYELIYVRRPNPIILEDLTKIEPNLKIWGQNKPIKTTSGSICELDLEDQMLVLYRAVEIAKAYMNGSPEDIVNLNARMPI